MRMRTKKWALPELNSCEYYVKSRDDIEGSIAKMFPKNQPIHLEIGCGKGVFTARVALRNTHINHFAIDLSTDVLGCAKRNIEKEYGKRHERVDNIMIMRYNATRLSELLSAQDKVRRIYINFCNPWPKAKHKKRRLTHPKLLEEYKCFLPIGGEIYFKTDDEELYVDSLQYLKDSGFTIVRQTRDLLNEKYTDESKIETEHEIMFGKQGKQICFLEALVI